MKKNQYYSSLQNLKGEFILQNTPMSCNYPAFLEMREKDGLEVRTRIDSIYRYFNEEEQKEYFWYHATHEALDGKAVMQTSYQPHVGVSHDSPPSEEFLWNPRNLAELKDKLTGKVNYYIARGERPEHAAAATITKEQFMTVDRKKILDGFKTVKLDLSDIAADLVKAQRGKVEMGQ